jgi:hypothetical protein
MSALDELRRALLAALAAVDELAAAERARDPRAAQAGLLAQAAAALDPRGELSDWQRAQRLAAIVARRARSARPAGRESERLVDEARALGRLPTSPRRLWDALTAARQSAGATLAASPNGHEGP